MIMDKRIKNAVAVALACVMSPLWAAAQVTMDRCLEMARENYPQARQLGLIEEAAKYDIASASKSWLPHFTVSGKASYQSDLEMIEVSMLDCGQQREELLKDKAAYVSMLEKLTGASLSGQASLWE